MYFKTDKFVSDCLYMEYFHIIGNKKFQISVKVLFSVFRRKKMYDYILYLKTFIYYTIYFFSFSRLWMNILLFFG